MVCWLLHGSIIMPLSPYRLSIPWYGFPDLLVGTAGTPRRWGAAPRSSEMEKLLKNLVCGSGGKTQSLGNAHQVGNGFNLHLFHHLAPMDLHGNFTRAKFGSGLFVQQSTDDQAHNLPFARGQCLVSGSQFHQLRTPPERLGVLVNRMLNRVEQILVPKRFRDEV